MARIRKVSRTIKTTKAGLMVVNTETQKVEQLEITVSGVFEDNVKLIKTIEKNNMVDSNIKIVEVVSKELEEIKYSMLESDFIKHAEKIM